MSHPFCSVVMVAAVALVSVLPKAEADTLPARELRVFAIPETTAAIALGPDGAMWVTGSHRLVRINANGGVSVVPVPENPAHFGTLDEGIVVGADGALWFADSQVLGVGRYVPGADAVQQYDVPGLRFPDGIAAGPDDAVWVTDPVAHKIARVALDGTSKTFDTGRRVAPGEIVAAPDGALWISDLHAPRILRLETSGVIRQFRFPGPGFALGLAVGPDSAVWFVEPEPARIGRMTSDGRVSEFSAGLPSNAVPQDMALGPDGNMWFTDYSGALGKITPAGHITSFGMFDWSPRDIAAGPDGALWFTNGDDSAVGRVPVAVCASRRVIRLHVRAPHGDRVRSVTVAFKRVERTKHGRWQTAVITLDLRGYIGGSLRVQIHAKTTAGRKIDVSRTFHTCRP